MSSTGIIKTIDEYAVHDGPGNRSLVFLKGCKLRCKWCQNPELQSFEPEIWFHSVKCTKCGRCMEVCPVGAIDLRKDVGRIDRNKCLGVECSKCVVACPAKAYEIVGFEISAEELYERVAKYKCFYGQRGGVTLTGGEPLHLPDFTAEVLKLCHDDGIHTAIETSLYCDYETLLKVVEHCDLIMCDIKHMNSEKHKEGTGVPNELILENLEKLDKDFKGEIVVRVPLIPGYNDYEENISATVKFLNTLKNIKGMDLLPFNVFPVTKYSALGRDWSEYKRLEKQSEEYLSEICDLVKSYGSGLRCTIGGLW